MYPCCIITIHSTFPKICVQHILCITESNVTFLSLYSRLYPTFTFNSAVEIRFQTSRQNPHETQLCKPFVWKVIRTMYQSYLIKIYQNYNQSWENKSQVDETKSKNTQLCEAQLLHPVKMKYQESFIHLKKHHFVYVPTFSLWLDIQYSGHFKNKAKYVRMCWKLGGLRWLTLTALALVT